MVDYDLGSDDGQSGGSVVGERDAVPTFANDQEEIEYWKEKYEEGRQVVEIVQAELEIIHLQSQDQESLISASETTITQLKNEVEDVRWKLEEERRRFREEGRGREEVMGGMQLAIDNLKKENENAKKAVVALEQGNDDLERETRNAHSSYLTIDSNYNRLMEEKVLLDEELTRAKGLQDEVQRLKDALNEQSDDMEYLENKAQTAQESLSEARLLISDLQKRLADLEAAGPSSQQTLSPLPSPTIAMMPKYLTTANLTTPSPTSDRFKENVLGRSPGKKGDADGLSPAGRSDASGSTATPTARQTNRGGAYESPSNLPRMRLGRVDSLRGGRAGSGSPGSPSSLKRSNTVDSISLGSPARRNPLNMSITSTNNGAAGAWGLGGGLNRSVNSRHISSMAGDDSPVRTRPMWYYRTSNMGFNGMSPAPGSRYGEKRDSPASVRHMGMHSSSTTPIRSRKESQVTISQPGAALTTQQQLTGRTTALLARIRGSGSGSGNASKALARKPSGALQRVTSGMVNVARDMNPLHRSTRDGRGGDMGKSGMQHKMQGIKGQEATDLTMITGSPNDSWVLLQEREVVNITAPSPEKRYLGDRYAGGGRFDGQAEMNTSTGTADTGRTRTTTSSTKSKALPSRKGIPSPLMPKNAGSRPDVARPPSRISSHHSASSQTSSAVSQRPGTPGADSRSSRFADAPRPDSRAGRRREHHPSVDFDGHDRYNALPGLPPPSSASNVAFPHDFQSSRPPSRIDSRPTSRASQRPDSRASVRPASRLAARTPSPGPNMALSTSRQPVAGLPASTRPATADIMTNTPAAFGNRSTRRASVQVQRTPSGVYQPLVLSESQHATPGGLKKLAYAPQPVTQPSGSKLPRRSLTNRTASVSRVTFGDGGSGDEIPPMPQSPFMQEVAARGRGHAGIGLGRPGHGF